MDQIISCTKCLHAIGLHAADGCGHHLRLRERCDCLFTAGDVIQNTLNEDERRRAQLLTTPMTWRAAS